jgi:hypothetical protein
MGFKADWSPSHGAIKVKYLQQLHISSSYGAALEICNIGDQVSSKLKTLLRVTQTHR